MSMTSAQRRRYPNTALTLDPLVPDWSDGIRIHIPDSYDLETAQPNKPHPVIVRRTVIGDSDSDDDTTTNMPSIPALSHKNDKTFVRVGTTGETDAVESLSKDFDQNRIGWAEERDLLSSDFKSPTITNKSNTVALEKRTKTSVKTVRVGPQAPACQDENVSTSADQVIIQEIVQIGVLLFNRSPETAVQLWIEHACVLDFPTDVAKFLISTKGLSKLRLGELFASPSPHSVRVFKAFTQFFDFAGTNFVIALTEFLEPFHVPPEADHGRRIFQGFGNKFSGDNPNSFPNTQHCVELVYAVIGHNQERHGNHSSKSLTRKQFQEKYIKLASQDILGDCHDYIATTALRPISDHVQIVAQIMASINGGLDLDEWAPPHRYFAKYIDVIEIVDISKKTPSGKKRRCLIIFNDVIFLCKARTKNYEARQIVSVVDCQAAIYQFPEYQNALCIVDIQSNKRIISLSVEAQPDIDTENESATIAELINHLHLQQRFESLPCPHTLDRLIGRIPKDVGDGKLVLKVTTSLSIGASTSIEHDVLRIAGVLSTVVYRKASHVLIKYDQSKCGPVRIQHFLISMGYDSVVATAEEIPTQSLTMEDDDSDDSDDYSQHHVMEASQVVDTTLEHESADDSDDYQTPNSKSRRDQSSENENRNDDDFEDDSDEYTDGAPDRIAHAVEGGSLASLREAVVKKRIDQDLEAYLRSVQAKNSEIMTALAGGEQLPTGYLHGLVKTGNVDGLSQLLLHAHSNINETDEEGMTPLMHGAQSNAIGCVHLLLLRNAEVNRCASNGATALHQAAYHSSSDEMLKLLLDFGATATAKDSGGRTPLHWATGNPLTASLSFLLKDERVTPTINAPSEDGMTPIMYAAFNNRADCVELLLEYGADVEEKDIEGKTAMHWAVHPEGDACLRQILTTAATYFRDHGGRTVSHRVAERGGNSAAALVFGMRPDAIEDVDREGRTPLIWAAACNNVDVVRTLLMASADVDNRAANGLTAYMHAHQLGNTACSNLISETRTRAYRSTDLDRH